MYKCVIQISLDLLNFNFGFLVLYKMYFQNYFDNRFIKLESFTVKLSQAIYTTFASILYLIYNSRLSIEFAYDTTRPLMLQVVLINLA